MQTLTSLIFFFFTTLALACPKSPPQDFSELKNEKGIRLFSNGTKSAVIGFKCEAISQAEAYKSLQFFEGRTVLDETTSYYSLKTNGNSISRIYFKVLKNHLVQASLTASIQSPSDLKDLEKTIVHFIQGAE